MFRIYQQNFVVVDDDCFYVRIIRTGTISIEEKVGNFANYLSGARILVYAILKFCFLSSESYLIFRDCLLRKKKSFNRW